MAGLHKNYAFFMMFTAKVHLNSHLQTTTLRKKLETMRHQLESNLFQLFILISHCDSLFGEQFQAHVTTLFASMLVK